MTIKSDKWIKKMAQESRLIDPFIDKQVKHTDEAGSTVSYGPIIAQAKFKTSKYKNIDSLIVKIHSVEHKLYPLILKKIVEREIDLLKLSGKNFKCYEDGFDF